MLHEGQFWTEVLTQILQYSIPTLTGQCTHTSDILWCVLSSEGIDTVMTGVCLSVITTGNTEVLWVAYHDQLLYRWDFNQVCAHSWPKADAY